VSNPPSTQASAPRATENDAALLIPPLEGRARLRKWLVVIAFLGIIAGAIIYFMWPEPPAERFRTLAVSRQDIVQWVEAAGRIDVRSRVEVPAPVEGQLVAVHVREGEMVKRGQVLAALDTRAPDLALRGAQAAASVAQGRVAEARASLNAAEQKLARARELLAQKLGSENDVANAKVEVARAQAGMESASGERSVAQQNIAAAQLTSSLGRLEAPSEGIVLRAPQRVGAAVSARAEPLFVIGEPLDVMRVDASVSETDVRFVKPGQAAEVVVAAAPARTFVGKVERVGIDADRVDGAVLYPVTLLVENQDNLLLPGMTARVRMNVASVENALAVHEAALRFSPPDAEPAKSRSRVWRRVSKDELAAVNLEVGISDGVHSQVVSVDGKLEVGDPLVVGLTQVDQSTEAPRIRLGKEK
jgi:HlyD family secretion protein